MKYGKPKRTGDPNFWMGLCVGTLLAMLCFTMLLILLGG